MHRTGGSRTRVSFLVECESRLVPVRMGANDGTGLHSLRLFVSRSGRGITLHL